MVPAVELGIGNEAAACERRRCAIVHESGEAVNADPAHRSGLRHGPKFAVVATEVRGVHVDGQVGQRPPEVHQCYAILGAKHWLRT